MINEKLQSVIDSLPVIKGLYEGIYSSGWGDSAV